jgi:hypothetical protein
VGLLDVNVPELASPVDECLVLGAVVQFADGVAAEFSRVQFLTDGRLRAELDCPVYLPAVGDSVKRKLLVSVTERTFFAAGSWLSVDPAPLGVLVVTVDNGDSTMIKAGVIRREANIAAREWIADQVEKEKTRSQGKCQLAVSPEVLPAQDIVDVEYQEWRIGPDAYNGREQIGKFVFRWLLPDGYVRPLRERAQIAPFVEPGPSTACAF